MLVHTSTGISNLFLFYNADYVVYVEGGSQSLSAAGAYAGGGSASGLDAKFWAGIFRQLASKEKFKFLSIGSKSSLKVIASDIQSGKIRNTFVCMDRDLDCYLNELIDHPSVFYTHGYSWENDVWTIETIESVFYQITPVEVSARYRSEIESLWAKFASRIRSLIGLEILTRIAGLNSMIGESTGGIFDQVNMCVNRSRVRQIVSRCRSQRKVKVIKSPDFSFSVEIDCRGHLVSFVSHSIVRHLHKSYSNSLSFATSLVVDALGISSFLHRFNSSDDQDRLYRYYLRQFSRTFNR